MGVVTIPTTYRLRAYLDREALKIAAHVRTVTFKNVVNGIYRGNLVRGIDPDAAAADADEAAAYLTARLEQIAAMMKSPATPSDRGRHHG